MTENSRGPLIRRFEDSEISRLYTIFGIPDIPVMPVMPESIPQLLDLEGVSPIKPPLLRRRLYSFNPKTPPDNHSEIPTGTYYIPQSPGLWVLNPTHTSERSSMLKASPLCWLGVPGVPFPVYLRSLPLYFVPINIPKSMLPYVTKPSLKDPPFLRLYLPDLEYLQEASELEDLYWDLIRYLTEAHQFHRGVIELLNSFVLNNNLRASFLQLLLVTLKYKGVFSFPLDSVDSATTTIMSKYNFLLPLTVKDLSRLLMCYRESLQVSITDLKNEGVLGDIPSSKKGSTRPGRGGFLVDSSAVEQALLA